MYITFISIEDGRPIRIRCFDCVCLCVCIYDSKCFSQRCIASNGDSIETLYVFSSLFISVIVVVTVNLSHSLSLKRTKMTVHIDKKYKYRIDLASLWLNGFLVPDFFLFWYHYTGSTLAMTLSLSIKPKFEFFHLTLNVCLRIESFKFFLRLSDFSTWKLYDSLSLPLFLSVYVSEYVYV